jgi:hypothetical protein
MVREVRKFLNLETFTEKVTNVVGDIRVTVNKASAGFVNYFNGTGRGK